jgi:hypothetical protein
MFRLCELVKEWPWYAPPNEGGPLAGKNLEQIVVIPITKHVSSYERGVNNWNTDKFWPLIEWDGNEICWIHYAKMSMIHLPPISTFTKTWKHLWSYKTLRFLTLNFNTTLDALSSSWIDSNVSLKWKQQKSKESGHAPLLTTLQR